MIHTIELDDTQVVLQKVIRRQKQDITLESSKTSRVIPEDYLSSEEFWKEADKRIIRVCKQYGVL